MQRSLNRIKNKRIRSSPSHKIAFYTLSSLPHIAYISGNTLVYIFCNGNVVILLAKGEDSLVLWKEIQFPVLLRQIRIHRKWITHFS